ncbi:MAG: YaiI/YqxD family protein [Proteobacteria bacterium]|nr:YaiI/YqxD family protein [Pseudomonadota bacterium]
MWVDADACPNVIKAILFKAAERTGIPLTLVANQPLTVPRLKHIRCLVVEQGFDVADNRIVGEVAAGDLVVTADIPLAADVLKRKAIAVNPRGMVYTQDNIDSHLRRRNFLEGLRATGEITGGPPSLDKADVQKFANALDRWLQAAKR